MFTMQGVGSLEQTEGIFGKSPVLQNLEKSGDRFVGGLGVDLMLGHSGMLIPASMDRISEIVHLGKADTALGQATGRQRQ